MQPSIRPATADDAEQLRALQQALDTESRFMLLEPAERDPDPAPLRRRLGEQAAGRSPSFTHVAAGDAELAGYVDVDVLPFARARGTGYVVMGVRAAYAGHGLGGGLLAAAVETARERGMRRLELTVMTHNQRALGLYLRTGFVVEGLRRSALSVDGAAVDEYYMGLLL
jgi:RimJ/RimL family protein N-acetyltransferase